VTDEDRDAVLEVLRNPILAHGPQSRGFEADFAEFAGDGAHCVSLSSCMAGLHLACVQFGLGPGDEVLVSAQTHVATAHAVEWVGAKPVFVDCDPATGNVTAELLRDAITPRTKAILLVHFVGVPAPMREIAELARERDLALIEDCALAVGSRLDGKHVGLFGDAGCFSFYPVKHLTTGEGGMLITRHEDVAASVRKLSAFGVDRSHSERKTPGQYEVPSLGLNYRLSEPAAALGRSQLGRIEENLERRRANFETLRDAVEGFEDVRVIDGEGNSHYCLTLVLEGSLGAKRDRLVKALSEAGVGTSLYYPQPVPEMAYYREKYGSESARFPAAAEISNRSIALPVGPHLEADDVEYVASRLRDSLEGIAP
jgi:dTDP-4-amino-4,6-dideoxygalactose transaminase